MVSLFMFIFTLAILFCCLMLMYNLQRFTIEIKKQFDEMHEKISDEMRHVAKLIFTLADEKEQQQISNIKKSKSKN